MIREVPPSIPVILPSSPSPCYYAQPSIFTLMEDHMRPGRITRSFYVTDGLWDEVKAQAHRDGVALSAVITKALTQYFATKVVRSSWTTEDEDSWYDPRSFYVKSEDKHGHSAYIRIWVPKHVGGQVGRIVGSGLIPEYRSSQDFFRDAIIHRAHQVGKWIDDDELISTVGMAVLIAEEAQQAQELADSEALITATRENLEQYWQREEYEYLGEQINKRIEKSGSIPEQFRDEYMMVLKGYKERLEGVASGKVKRITKQRAETAN